MNSSQRTVVLLAAVLIAARTFFPVQHLTRPGGTHLATTTLHVFGILALAAALYFIPLAPRTYVALAVALATVALSVLRLMIPVQGAPTWSSVGPTLDPSLSDRFLLTLGIWSRVG